MQCPLLAAHLRCGSLDRRKPLCCNTICIPDIPLVELPLPASPSSFIAVVLHVRLLLAHLVGSPGCSRPWLAMMKARAVQILCITVWPCPDGALLSPKTSHLGRAVCHSSAPGAIPAVLGAGRTCGTCLSAAWTPQGAETLTTRCTSGMNTWQALPALSVSGNCILEPVGLRMCKRMHMLSACGTIC